MGWPLVQGLAQAVLLGLFFGIGMLFAAIRSDYVKDVRDGRRR